MGRSAKGKKMYIYIYHLRICNSVPQASTTHAMTPSIDRLTRQVFYKFYKINLHRLSLGSQTEPRHIN